MSKSLVELAIIIVNWNTREMLARCLESLTNSQGLNLADSTLSSTENGRFSQKIYVVDNASSDGSVEMIKARFPWVHIIENSENLGFARANNQALLQSRGSYAVLLNSDTVLHPHALDKMVEFMDSHPEAGGCGPRLLNADGSLQSSCHPLLTPWREFWRLILLDRIWHRATYPQAKWDLRTPRRVEVIKGACLLLRREALKEVGLLDDRYFMYTEEMDLCYRLLKAGWDIWWVPQAVVTHYGEASSQQMAEDMYIQLYQSKVQFHRKFGGPQRVQHFKFLLKLAYWPRWVMVSLGAQFRPQLAVRARIYRRLLSELTAM